MDDDANQDTVRSVAELIKPDTELSEDEFDNSLNRYQIENELVKRGFPAFDRLDSQSPPSIVASSGDKDKGKASWKITWTRTLVTETISVCVLAIIIITATSIIYHFYHQEQYFIELGKRIYFHEDTRQLEVNNVDKLTVLHGNLGVDIPPLHLPYDCSDPDKIATEKCLHWRGQALLNITYYEEGSTSCYDIEWESLNPVVMPHDCYELSGGNWYGGAITAQQAWPVEQYEFEKRAFVSANLHSTDKFGPVLERYWLSSLGVAIFVEDDSPLFVSLNTSSENEQLCLYADYTNSPYLQEDMELPKLNYTICVDRTVRNVHSFVVNKIGNPSMNVPNEEYFKKPVWSTWGQYHYEVTQQQVENYALDITSNGYPGSLLFIDSGWQSNEGDLAFDSAKFPDPVSMLNGLRSNFIVGLTMSPYVSISSANFETSATNDYLVYDTSGSAPGLFPWWTGPPTTQWSRGFAASIDMHSPATQWWKTQVDIFKSQYGYLEFHMGGGEVENLPHGARFHNEYKNPGQYCRALVEFTTGIGQSSHVRCAYRAQDKAVIVRLSENNSTWSALQAVIPTVLNVGIVGYPYIMPDAAGGNKYVGSPSKELYIRWMQLNAFMPIMHFSIPPTSYDEQTKTIATDMIKLHEDVVSPIVIDLARNSSKSMYPIILPMWWYDPADNETYALNDQFMLGYRMLVAPVVTENIRMRNIYFPKGVWRDQRTQIQYEGPQYHNNIQAPLEYVPYFLLV